MRPLLVRLREELTARSGKRRCSCNPSVVVTGTTPKQYILDRGWNMRDPVAKQTSLSRR